MAFFNSLPVQELLQIFSELVQGEGGRPPGRPAVAPGVQGDDPVPVGEGAYLALEVGVILSVAVEEDQGEALPRLHIVQRDVHAIPPDRWPPGGGR